MKVVIIGASGHYHQVFDAISGGLKVDLAAVAPGSKSENMTKLLSRTDAKVYEDWKEMLDTEKPDVAVVNPWFSDISKISVECLNRGVHTYSEKPLAIEMDELQAVRTAYENSTASLGCMLNLNCCAWFKTVEKAIQDGEIGYVRVIHGQKSYRMGVRDEYYRTRATYGGTIPWIGIHAIDWVLHLGGKCKSVSAVHTTIENRGHGDMESAGSVLLSLESGVIGTCDIDYLRPIGSARHDDDRLRVTGTKGMIEAVDGVVTLENDEKKRVLPLEEGVNPFTRFINAIGTEEAARLAEAAFEDTRISLLARQAADEERTIRA